MNHKELLKAKLLELSVSFENEHIEVSKWLLKNLLSFVDEISFAAPVITNNRKETVKFRKSAEKELIKETLEKFDGHREATANELGISDRTLYRKIKQYNL